MPIGIGLNDRHDQLPGFFAHGLQISLNGIQIDQELGIIKLQIKSTHLD